MRTFCGACGTEIAAGFAAKHPITDVPMHPTCITVPCETCGTPTRMTGTKRCDGCHEVEKRLAGYLRKGLKAIEFVRRTLTSEETLQAAERDLKVLQDMARSRGVRQ